MLLEPLESRRVLAGHPLFFAPPVNYAAGDSPNSVAVADFNLDGKADTATANFDSDNVTVRLGNGDGSFGAASTFAGGPNNRGVFVGDFNKDNKIDLAISVENLAVLGAGDVRVLLGNGDGTFAAASILPSVGNPTWLQLADLNGDTNLDIVSGNGTGDSLSVYLGNGNGTFQPRVVLSTGLGSNPFTATVGDFNNDGKLDLISSNTGPGTGIPNGNDNITVFLGNGSGTSFTNFGSVTVGDGPGIAVAEDFNTDGKLDLAVQNFTSGTVSVLIGNGNGTFAAPVNSYDTGPNNSSVVAGDFNGDGTIDLAASSFNAASAATSVGQLKVLLGNPNGTFQAAVVARNVGHVPGGLAVGDFDGDGMDDIAAPNNLDDNVSILLNRDQLIVNTTSDAVADDALISLREAITFANTHANALNAGGLRDTIRFAIPGAGPRTIAPIGANLPQITEAVIIDGASQPGYAPGAPLIVINGSNLGSTSAPTYGLFITSGNSLVKGLVINGYQTVLTPGFYNGGVGIYLKSGGGNVIQGNFLGTDATGAASVDNTGTGITIESSSNNLIGGSNPDEGNLVSGNSVTHVDLESGAANNTVEGNTIGTDITGSYSLSNVGFGGFSAGVNMALGANHNSILRNLISGHVSSTGGGGGVFIHDSGSTNNVVQGNLIGTDLSGVNPIPNQVGLSLGAGGNANTIGGVGPGQGNVIAYSKDDGVAVDSAAVNNAIRGNSIYANTKLGIDLGNNGITLNDNLDVDGGANNLQNFPVLLLPVLGGPTTTVQGSLNSTPSSTFTIDFYASAAVDGSGYGEGQTWIGSTTVGTDASGNASFNVTLNVSLSSGVVSATATNNAGSTSEFSLVPINHNPTFTSPAAFSVPENTTSVGAITTSDIDLPAQTVILAITGGADAGKFSLSGGSLSLVNTPDFESPGDANGNNVYEVQVTATDGFGGSAVQNILVNITPVNDNSPLFTSGTAFSVAENTTSVTTVAATDADLPIQTITFSVVGGVDAARFSITSGGLLMFNAAPNFESPNDADHNNIYLMRVEANDNAGHTTLQDIAVNVTGVNENSPVFTSSNSFNVPENSSAVGLIAATDDDLPTPTVTISITGGADGSRFTLASDGTLTFNSPPDFESPADVGANNIYDLQVTADDGAGGTTVQNIAVTVTPVNDNGPSFTSPASFTISENTAAVETVAATDADQPIQTVTFTIDGGDDASRFAISSSGLLTFTSPPDYEAPADANGDNVYLVRVKADDGAGGSRTQEIAVTVTGENEFNPVFTSGTSFHVNENSTAVTTVAATDADLPAQAITFSISGGDDANQFTITSDGVLQFASPPDYEAFDDANHDNVYNVIVSASDGAGGVATQTIDVTLGNVNDNSPVFNSSGSLTVPENSTSVGTVIASDADLPPQTITYGIMGGADAAQFSITSGGVLTFNPPPDFENPSDADHNNTYQIIVTADDGNGATTPQTIVVTVTGLNDNSPSFTSPATFSVPENTTAVGAVVATDADLPAQTITYSICGGADAAKFTITSGGMLSFVSPPAYEAPGDVGGDNVYNVQIQASDGAGGITVQDTTIGVTDVDEALGQVFLNGRVLMILGTNDPDHVVVNTEGRGIIKVHADFLPTNFVTFPLSSVDRIQARLFGGDDQMTIAGNVQLPALMDGGVGNDQLNAGGGPTILLGGPGSDQLGGGSANSLLIGGLGADRFNGGSGDDLLIGGTTAYDNSDTALQAILSEWSSSRTYDARVANIRGTGIGPRLNGTNFLTKGTGATVFDDTASDKATGAAGDDWFLLDLASDVASDRKTKEQLN